MSSYVHREQDRYVPTYYNLFPVEGEAIVKVHFGAKSGCDNDWLASQKFRWVDLKRIIDPETDEPYEIMLLDDGFWRVDEYKISLAKKQLTIVVGEPMQVTHELIQSNNRWISEV